MRANRTTWQQRANKEHKAFHIALKTALKSYRRPGLIAMVKEIRNVAVEKGAIVPVNPIDLTYKDLKKVITSALFFKEKFSPTGEFQ
jgi:hypothetical protein